MDDICKKIREQIPELIGAGLSAEKAVELEQHRSQCPACNEYFQALLADDKLLCEFAQAMQPSVTRLENIAMDELGRRQPGTRAYSVPAWRRVVQSRTSGIAAAALVVVAVLIGAAIFGGPDEEPVEVAGQVNEPNQPALDLPKEDKPDLDAVLAAELGEIREMFAASDVAGLVAMLDNGQPQSKLAAANYLAQIGDVQALSALGQLSAEWDGEAANNPFIDALEQIVSRLGQQERESEADEEEKETSVAETTTGGGDEDVGCRGIVVDEQGRAVADAKILLYHNLSIWGLGNRVLEETVSTDDGAFVCKQAVEFSSVKDHSYDQDTYILMATHPDYAFGWRNITQGSEQASYRIVLTKPAFRGVIVTDWNENPLAGVRIWLHNAGDRESPKAIFRDDLTLATDVGFAGGTTDAKGRVALRNLPDTYSSFRTTLKGHAEAVVTPTERITRIHLNRGASISGWVLAEGDKPVAGATVSFATNWMHHYFLAESDNEGYFHIEGLPAQGWDQSPWGKSEGASGSYTITLKHESCGAAETNVTLLPGQSIDDFIIEAHSDTTLVECRVVEFGTDVPVAGVRIYGSNKIGKIDGCSDSEGIFAVRVLPGSVSLSFYSPPDGVYVFEDHKPVESSLTFNASGERMTVTLKTPPIAGLLRSVAGIVFGPDGLAQSEGKTVVYAGAGKFKTSTASDYVRPVGVDSGGHFELKEVPAGRKLYLYVETKDRTLAATDVLEIPDDPDWSGYLGINLRATQNASVVVSDEGGNVVPDRDFTVSPLVEGERIWPAERKARTDENGLLEMDGIVPGLEYYLRSVEPEMRTGSSRWDARMRAEARSRQVILKMVLIPLEP